MSIENEKSISEQEITQYNNFLFRLFESREKYIYYLMATSGTVLAYIVVKSGPVAMDSRYLLLLASALSLVVSIVIGSFGIFSIHAFYDARLDLLVEYSNAKSSTNQYSVFDRNKHSEIIEKVTAAMNRSSTLYIYQFCSLASGAVCFLVWKFLSILR